MTIEITHVENCPICESVDIEGHLENRENSTHVYWCICRSCKHRSGTAPSRFAAFSLWNRAVTKLRRHRLYVEARANEYCAVREGDVVRRFGRKRTAAQSFVDGWNACVEARNPRLGKRED